MTNMRMMFKVNNGEASGWTDSTHTTFILSIEDNYLRTKVKSGRDPFPEEISTAFGRLLQAYEAETGEKVAVYERRHPYRFTFREGVSGCQTAFIEIDKGDGFPDRRCVTHQTCFGKTPGLSCFVYDFLDLCVVDGFLKVEDGAYVYPEADDEFAKVVDMKEILPRNTGEEEGWTYPGSWPEKVVPLQVCRGKATEE